MTAISISFEDKFIRNGGYAKILVEYDSLEQTE